MDEKFYRPIIGEGDHLVSSRDNPDRVRGLTRDENNKNPNIPEWEEVNMDELMSETLSTYKNTYNYSYRSNDDYDDDEEEDQYQLTPEQEELAQFIGAIIMSAIIVGAESVYRNHFRPWYHNKVLPWIQAKREKSGEKKKMKRLKEDAETIVESEENSLFNTQLEDIFSGFDRQYEQLRFEMDEKEAVEHLMKLIYHMLGVINEIRILSNSVIQEKCGLDLDPIEAQKTADIFWAEAVAGQLDKWLNDSRIKLDLDTSRELFNKTGGGVFLNGEYAPVQVEQVELLMQSIAAEPSQQ